MLAAFHPMATSHETQEKPCGTVTTDIGEMDTEADNMTNTQSTVKITTAKRYYFVINT